MPAPADTPVVPAAVVGPRRTAVGYVVLLAAAVGAFLLIRSWGETLPPPAAAAPPDHAEPSARIDVVLPRLLLALAVIIVACRLVSWLFRRLGQPPVIGEVVAGIVLGPSLLGRVWPAASAFVLPREVAPFLGVIAQIGVVLYMFLVGLELNADLLRRRAHAAVTVAHASIAVPFVLGAALALGLFTGLAPAGVPFTSFALFMGAALSVTAFPVLARILSDRRMDKTPLGVLALGCAAAVDATAWCLLAFVVGVARAEVSGALLTVGLSVAFLVLMVGVVRPLAVRFAARFTDDNLPRGAVAWVFVALLLSALTTEAIGIHAVFGAFLLGAVIPHDSAVARAFTRRLEDIVTVLLLPAFFAFTGMRTQIGLVQGVEGWLVCGVIILAATAGKFGGTFAAARFTGLDARTSTALGVLMNTRGLMELIVLNVGLDLGVLSPTLFAMMVVMALVTTLATAPALAWLVPSAGAATQSRLPDAVPSQ
jgi:Kef-type K+ transport system membrane component KefB